MLQFALRHIWFALWMLAISGIAPPAVFARPALTVIESRCVECHNKDERSGEVDLTILLREENSESRQRVTELWTRAEEMVAARKMPPEDEPPLSAADREAVIRWYRANYILRDGEQHIGVTPLRRLTRYELENTLEELLAIKLKQPYVFSSESVGLFPSTIEQLYPTDTPGESGFDNDADRLRNVKIPVLKYIACLDFALRKFDQDANAREKVLGFSDKSKTIEPATATQILARFKDRAARGYQNPDEWQEILRVWKKASQQTTAYRAVRQAMKATLLSPSFMYRLEASKDQADPYQVRPHELAVRLSYFLWASMPDEALFNTARNGTLLQEDVLKQQIGRMLDSPKRLALSENFAGQWLVFDELRRNKVFYRGESWTRGVYDELLFGFDELIKSDRSVLEIVDSDWAYLRRAEVRQAGGKSLRFTEKYADIFEDRRSRSGLKVERFYDPPRLYKVRGDRLGGMVTAAGIMRLTSAPDRTSPIRRGVWLLEKIIGEELEPPENIPPLADAKKKLNATQPSSPAEILKIHTSQASCRACHQHIDPLGLGLENFSPNGDWRTSYADKTPIVSSGVLPNGRAYSSPKQLKQELLTFYRDRIVENIIRKMLAYAIGRKLQPHDRVTIENIHHELVSNNYRIGVLIEQIVLSKQFRCRQDRT